MVPAEEVAGPDGVQGPPVPAMLPDDPTLSPDELPQRALAALPAACAKLRQLAAQLLGPTRTALSTGTHRLRKHPRLAHGTTHGIVPWGRFCV